MDLAYRMRVVCPWGRESLTNEALTGLRQIAKQQRSQCAYRAHHTLSAEKSTPAPHFGMKKERARAKCGTCLRFARPP